MKIRREIIVTAVLLLVIAALVLLLRPYDTAISYRATDYEYSASDPSVAIAHDVVIEGTYTRYLFKEDTFSGTFYISDIDGVGDGVCSFLSFRHNSGIPYFTLIPGTPPRMSDIMNVFAEPNFKTLAVQFCESKEAFGNRVSRHTSYPGGTFLVPGAKSREEAYETYLNMLYKAGILEEGSHVP